MSNLFLNLPTEIKIQILEYFSWEELVILQLVSKNFEDNTRNIIGRRMRKALDFGDILEVEKGMRSNLPVNVTQLNNACNRAITLKNSYATLSWVTIGAMPDITLLNKAYNEAKHTGDVAEYQRWLQSTIIVDKKSGHETLTLAI